MSPVMSARSETTSAANQKAASKGAAGSRCIGCPNDSFEWRMKSWPNACTEIGPFLK
jgi:hypothetical protein